jgi:hypothetical protein
MPPRTLACLAAAAIAIALMDFNVAAGATQGPLSLGHVAPDSWPTATAATRTQRRLVRIADPVAGPAIRSALDAAVARFAEAGCRRILLEFVDHDARPLQDRLTSLGLDFDTYVSMLVIYDGTRSRTCDKGALAFTVPGSRVIHVCVDRLKSVQSDQPEYVIAALIHEILHTLGLGENPPSSNDITKRVLALCGRRRS